jgi:CheY-like chemotaxis protein
MMRDERWSSPQIALVDDQPPYREILEDGLRRKGINASVDVFAPMSSKATLGGCQLPEGVEWDKYDLAFVDLDLSGRHARAAVFAGDLAGGSEILPEIRHRAPWLPVLSCSGFYQSGDFFILIAGTFPFDAHFPKPLESQLDNDAWCDLFNAAERNALVRTLGQGFADSREKGVDVRAATNALEASGLDPVDVRAVLGRLFYDRESVSLEPVPPGFSGASTFRAKAMQRSLDGARESDWLVKLGSSSVRLQGEAEAHLHFQRAGIGMLRSVPLLWPNVVRSGRVSAIAYQFAANTVDGVEAVSMWGAEAALTRFTKLLLAFHSTSVQQTAPHSSLFDSKAPSGPDYREVVESLTDGETKSLLLELSGAHQAPSHRLSQLVTYSSSLLHGDLNIRNFMLGERDILIDFEYAAVGPVAIDLAGFSASLLLYARSLRAGCSFDASTTTLILPCTTELVETVLTTSDDNLLYAEFVVSYLAGALRWPAIPRETKEWVRLFLRA